MKKLTFVALFSAICLAQSAPAQASLITAGFAGTVVDFSQFNGGFNFFGAGPLEVGGLVSESISLRSTAPNAVIGDSGYGLGSNGSWSGRSGYVGLNNTSVAGQYVEFTFNAGGVSSVGGFVNYATCGGDQCAPAQRFLMEVLNSANVVLESYDITTLAPINTPGGFNDGAFRGITRATNDIASIRLYNAVNVIDDLTFSRDAAAVPEPATLVLLASGLAVGYVRARRKQ